MVRLLIFFQKLLKNMSICWLYPLVVLLLRLHNVEAELLVKLYRTLVVDLHVCEDKSIWPNTLTTVSISFLSANCSSCTITYNLY